jgi:hypothetical protein
VRARVCVNIVVRAVSLSLCKNSDVKQADRMAWNGEESTEL